MDKIGLYIQWSIIQPLKKDIQTDANTWMNLEDIMLCEISKTQKNKSV